MNTVIIGAGITGLSTAYHLKKDYLVLEKENKAGGLCRSFYCDGFTFDFTGHAIHLRDNNTKKFIFNLLKNNVLENQRHALIYSNRVLTKYPFQANLYGLPAEVIKECILGLIDAKMNKNQDGSCDNLTFKQWVLTKFGKGFAKHFFLPYNEKLWTISMDTLTSQWVAPFVPQPKIEDVVNGAFVDQKKKYGYNTSFYYPKFGGIQSLSDALSHSIPNIALSAEVKQVDWKRKIIYYNDKKVNYGNLVSSMPLPLLLSLMKELPGEIRRLSGLLRWNSTICINAGVDSPGVMGKTHWIYYPEKKYIFYRIGFYHNFSKNLVPKNNSSMYVEVSYSPRQKINMEKILAAASEDMIRCGILRDKKEIKTVKLLDIPCSYVIYDNNRQACAGRITEFLKNNSIYSIGRYGAWKYSYMAESIVDGKNTADYINNRN